MKIRRSFAATAVLLFCVGCLPTVQPVALKAPTFNIPPLAGNGSAAGFCVNALEAIPAPMEIKASPSFRLAYDDHGLHVWVNVPDSTPNEAKEDLYLGDSVEIFVGRADQPNQHYQLVVSPGRTAKHPAPRQKFYDLRKDKSDPQQFSADVSAKVRPDGYDLDIVLPWSNLRMSGASGAELTFQLVVNDAWDDTCTRFAWFPSLDASWKPDATYRLSLANSASPSVDMGAAGGYQEFRRTVVTVNGVGSLAGKTVELRDNSTALASATLGPASEGQSGARLLLPIPARDHPYPPLAVMLDGNPVSTLTLPPLPRLQDALDAVPFTFHYFVFDTENFPSGKFDAPLAVEDIIGPYTVTTDFYDAKLNHVTHAEKPGRYGAIVEIHYGNHELSRRFYTLYKLGAKFDWTLNDIPFNVEFPPVFGIDPISVGHQKDVVACEFNHGLHDAMRSDQRLAIMLAGLSEIDPHSTPAAAHTNPWFRFEQCNDVYDNDLKWWILLKHKLGIMHHNYLVYTPKGFDQAAATRWPMILSLHGSGDSGTDLNMLRLGGLPARLEKSMDIPFIVVAPQLPAATWWNPYDLNDLLDEIMARYPVDPDRIYVTGSSLGGFGTWRLAETFPQRFAAVAPICGIGDMNIIARMKDLPTWVFHGDADPRVSIKSDTEVINELKRIGGRVKFTIYPGVGHNAWTPTYANPELYTWFLEQKRGQPAQPPATQPVR